MRRKVKEVLEYQNWFQKVMGDYYIHNIRKINKGVGELNTPRLILQAALIMGIFLNTLGFDIKESSYITAILAVAGLVMCWILGHIWDWQKLFVIEAEWSNKRNQFVDDMRKSIKKNRR